MKIQENIIDNKLVTQVFITQKEFENEECKQQISDLKKDKANVVIFSSGNKNIDGCLKYILQIIKNKTHLI